MILANILTKSLNGSLMSKDELGAFQFQLMAILKDLILRYTKGESTSVTIETAESILNSIFYSIDMYLSEFSDEVSLKLLKTGNIKELHEKGIEAVANCLKECKELYLTIKRDKLKIPLQAYNDTINESLPIFFEKYEVVFGAHNTITSIDYPLLIDDMNVNGILYIKNYLETLMLENEFCRFFLNVEIENVLISYGRIYRMDYKKTLTNIFELVLNASFFSLFSGGNVTELSISHEKYGIILKKLNGKNIKELDEIILENMSKVIKYLFISESKISSYIEMYIPTLKSRIANAIKTESLDKLILISDLAPLASEKTVFVEGERMMNESFRDLAEKLINEMDSQAKIDIIKSDIHSLDDFTDILEADCIFGNEYNMLFSQLSNSEIAVLVKIVFNDEIRDEVFNLSKATLFHNESGIEWYEHMIEFIKTLSDERIKAIEILVNDIIY